MIQERFYTEKEGRDPNIYLGIDENPIPIEYVKGIYSTAGNIYTDNPLWGEIQFLVTEDEKYLKLITMNPDSYVTKEDLQSTDIWFKIGHSLMDVSSPWSSIQESIEKDPWYNILQRYQNGETGLLEYEEKKFNDKGEYMRVYKAFDTRPLPEATDIRGNIIRHINLAYIFDREVPFELRRSLVKTNSENIAKLNQFALEQVNSINTFEFGEKPMAELPEQAKFKSFMLPGIGLIELEEDNSVQDFLVTKL